MVDSPETGIMPQSYWLIERNNAQLIDAHIIKESRLSIYVNAQELATIMCSPLTQEALAIGFLFNEGIIDSIDEVGLVKANSPRSTVDIFLKTTQVVLPHRLVITSGCGGGVTAQQIAKESPALTSAFATTPAVLFQMMKELKGVSRLYNQVRGVHISALSDARRLLISAEDVGRHNTIDKVAGKALQSGLSMRDCLLLTSGRISSEMLTKARRMEIPIVVSRTSPTSITVQLAQAWNICVVGYVRQGSMRVYTHPERLGLKELVSKKE